MHGLALSSGKQDLIIDPPVMNSAGILGFAPEDHRLLDLTLLGAFVTPPITRGRRSPARPTRFVRYPGGVMLHTGLPNPGLRSSLRDYAGRWASLGRPVILHVLTEGVRDLNGMVELLEMGEHPIQALEIGLPDQIPPHEVAKLLHSAAKSQLPLLARVAPDVEKDILHTIQDAGANAVVIGPPRGSLGDDGECLAGRLYGPSLRPLAHQHLERLLHTVELPVIMGCGLYSAQDIRSALACGAAAVQLDTMLWLDPQPVIQSLLTAPG